LYAVLFILWIIFNGRVTLEIVIFGAVICAAVFLFMVRFMDYSLKLERNIYRLLPRLIAYLGLLIVEIIKSSLNVVGYVTGKKKPDPLLLRFRVPLKTDFAKTLLANSITLTPGTITENVKGDIFRVHCLDRTMADGIEECSFVKALIKMEEVMDID